MKLKQRVALGTFCGIVFFGKFDFKQVQTDFNRLTILVYKWKEVQDFDKNELLYFETGT